MFSARLRMASAGGRERAQLCQPMAGLKLDQTGLSCSGETTADRNRIYSGGRIRVYKPDRLQIVGGKIALPISR